MRRKVVDARYSEASIPATHPLPFEVAPGARVVAVNDLPAADVALSYAVLGSGKTAADACTWLLENGVEADRIRWIRPRDAWFYDRRHWQPLDQVAAIMEGISSRCRSGGQRGRHRGPVRATRGLGEARAYRPVFAGTMYRGTMLSAGELAALREIDDVVRLGRVQRIETDRIVLEQGESRTSANVVHVDCTALGLNNAPATAIFQPGRIVLQQVRYLSPCFNAALIAFVEAHRDDDAEKNRLCPSTPYPSKIEDWPRLMCTTWRLETQWLSEPDLAAWMAASRLNLMRALPDHATEPAVQTAVKRYLAHAGAAIERTTAWDKSGE